MQVHQEDFDSFPAIELSNFAVNKAYKDNHPDITKLGTYIFINFILPLSRCLAKYVGLKVLFIYALPEEKLISHYKTMGFSRLPQKQEKIRAFSRKAKIR